VNAANANASRALYTPNSGVNYTAGINADYEVDDNNSVSFTLMSEVYSEQIRKSSIVSKSNTVSANVVYSYHF
jgi:outer membrane scaffolding protein for murein synthesis (MipA/OmpV family)